MDTCAPSHYAVSATKPGTAVTDAEVPKCQKHNDLIDYYCFQPAAIERPGAYGKSTATCLSCLAKQLGDLSCKPRERDERIEFF